MCTAVTETYNETSQSSCCTNYREPSGLISVITYLQQKKHIHMHVRMYQQGVCTNQECVLIRSVH